MSELRVEPIDSSKSPLPLFRLTSDGSGLIVAARNLAKEASEAIEAVRQKTEEKGLILN